MLLHENYAPANYIPSLDKYPKHESKYFIPPNYLASAIMVDLEWITVDGF